LIFIETMRSQVNRLDFVARAKLRLRQRSTVRANVTTGINLKYGERTVLWAPSSLIIGNNVGLGSDVRIEVDGTIGDGVLIANGVGIIGRRDHNMRELGVTIQSAEWVGENIPKLSLPVAIGSDVWIGFGAIVLSGVSIGDSCVIGAGAVVTTDIPANSIVIGNPAKVVGLRFDEHSISEHWRLLRASGIRLTTTTTTANRTDSPE
jgi:acetyltransferase-like isoleucine patch superfamily enzyme